VRLGLKVVSKWWNRNLGGNTQERETATEELREHLKRIGVDATIGFKESNLKVPLWKLVLKVGSPERIIGSVRVANKNIDLVELEWWRIHEPGPGPDSGGDFENGYRCCYLVQTGCQNSDFWNRINATGKPIRKGWFNREVVGFNWRGRDLAQALNNYSVLKDCLVAQRSPS
jgi:hypothetical protein